MGAANCSCKGVSKECFVVLPADDGAVHASSPSHPSAREKGTAKGALQETKLDKEPDLPAALSSAKTKPKPNDLLLERQISVTSSTTSVQEGGARLKPEILAGFDVEASAAKDSLKSPSSDGSPSTMSAISEKTMSSQDPEMAAKILAYKKRQVRKGKTGKKAGAAGSDGYLSELPEVDADVPYRFSFEVTGVNSEEVVAAACQSSVALMHKTPEENSLPSPLPAFLSRSSSNLLQPFTCLGEVLRDWSKGKQRLVKMGFRSYEPGKLPKASASSSEAASSCVVFMISAESSESLVEQLSAADEGVQHLKQSIPATRRPVVAVLLLDAARKESIEVEVKEHEANCGQMLRFGPFDPEDGDSIFEAFRQIADMRITAMENGFENKALWKSMTDDDLPPWPLVLPLEN
mmetsp:Transcript_38898/g.70144  ORF Transcript_38898/g.70144 Transcript_38898/m.70144 type:complete len:406 (-) Transcript_38898:68-1285(-)